jgi:hypothetical protein
MATVTNISYSFQDADGNRATTIISLPSTTLFADLTDFASDAAILLDAVSDAVITDIAITYTVALPGGIKTDPVANSNVQESALFTLNAANTVYKAGIRVPALVQAMFTGREVDTTDADITALVNALVSGLTENGNNVSPTDKFANDLTGLSKAVKVFRKA